MNSRLLRLSLIAFVITSLAAHGSVTPPPYSPKPDSNNPTFRAEEVTMDTGAVTLAGTNYYTQLSIVPNSIHSGATDELTRFVYHSPNSFVFAVDMLGFFFLGLATLCAAPLFENGKLERAIRWLFVAFGIENIAGLLAHAFAYQFILLIYNLLMTVTIFAASVLLAIYFRDRKGKP